MFSKGATLIEWVEELKDKDTIVFSLCPFCNRAIKLRKDKWKNYQNKPKSVIINYKNYSTSLKIIQIQHLISSHHLESRRDFPEPGPPDTSRGGVGGGAAIMSFKRSIYWGGHQIQHRLTEIKSKFWDWETGLRKLKRGVDLHYLLKA